MRTASPENLTPIIKTMRREVSLLPRDIQEALVREADYERARIVANEEIAAQIGITKLTYVTSPIQSLIIGGLVAEEILRRTR